MEEQNKFKWSLKWSGSTPKESLTEVVNYLKTYTMWDHCKAHLIDHAAYQDMVANGEIAPPQSYWQIKEGEVGLVAIREYDHYTKTWEGINTAKGDFEAGFNAGEKKYKMLKAHEEAIEINKLLNKYKVEEARPCTQYNSQYNNGDCINCNYYKGCPPRSKSDIMSKLCKQLAERSINHFGQTIRISK
jgi:hypothetical protein